MTMIEITEDKLDNMSELVGKMLKYGSRLMDCLDDVSKESGRMGNRYDDYRDGRREHDEEMNWRRGKTRY